MEVTTVEAVKPDVNVRLSAEEARLLRRLFGDLTVKEIADSLGHLDDSAVVRDIYALANDIFTELANLDY